MDAPPGSLPSIESLLEHADWVRALARTLVRDPDRADDVVQETWLSALESPPRDARNPRGWLGAIVRNAVRRRARSDERRLAREAASARTEAGDDTADLVARASLQRELVGHVLALEEPYRTTVLLRFFEGLEARTIAERDGVPLPTVRSRLQRALAELRRRLDSAYGDRGAWIGMFLPLTSVRPIGPATAGSSAIAIVLGLSWKIAVIAVVVGGTWRLVRDPKEERSPTQVAVASNPPSEPPTREADSRVAPAQERRASERAVAAKTPMIPQEVASLGTISVSGVVVDPRGRPLPDLPIRARDRSLPRLADGWISIGSTSRSIDDDRLRELRADPRLLDAFVRDLGSPPGLREVLAGTDLASHGRTSTDGNFRLDVRGQSASVETESDDWTVVGDGHAPGRAEWILIASPAVTVSGIVVGEDEIPIPRARLDVGISCDALPEFPMSLYGGTAWSSWSAESDTQGTFRFVGIPCGGGTTIRAQLRDVASGSVPVPDHSTDDVRIVLKPSPRGRRPVLRGVVVDENGAAVEKAWVQFGQDSCSSDSQGFFEISVSTSSEGTPLTATLERHAAAVIEAFDQRFDRRSAGLDGIVLRLGGEPPTIRGRILDADGRACVGWIVDLEDGTPYGTTSNLNVERATTGRLGNNGLAKTDARGQFVLEGLRVRPYRVQAWSEPECLVLVGDPVDAGSQDLELRIPRDARIPRLPGRVLGQRGQPVSDAEVSVSFTLSRLPDSEHFTRCKTARTDSDGRFVIEDAPRRNAYLTVWSAILDEPKHFAIPTEDGTEVHIQANVICRFRVRLRKEDPADGFTIPDGEGKQLEILEHRPDSESENRLVARGDGQFPVCSVSETAAVLVLCHRGQEIRRTTIQLTVPDLQFLDL